MTDITPPTEEPLCLSCGFCCDGTLFDRAPLEPDDDLAPLKNAGFEIRTKVTKKEKIKTFFALPCVEFRQNCCQIYDQPRPAICGRYRCSLLKKYEAGEIVREDAEQKIGRVLELRKIVKTEAEQALPGSGRLSITAILKIIPENKEIAADPQLQKKWGAVMLSLSALLDCVQTHFQPPFRKKKSASSPEKSEDTLI